MLPTNPGTAGQNANRQLNLLPQGAQETTGRAGCNRAAALGGSRNRIRNLGVWSVFRGAASRSVARRRDPTYRAAVAIRTAGDRRHRRGSGGFRVRQFLLNALAEAGTPGVGHEQGAVEGRGAEAAAGGALVDKSRVLPNSGYLMVLQTPPCPRSPLAG